jgi:hypothetical protein
LEKISEQVTASAFDIAVGARIELSIIWDWDELKISVREDRSLHSTAS